VNLKAEALKCLERGEVEKANAYAALHLADCLTKYQQGDNTKPVELDCRICKKKTTFIVAQANPQYGLTCSACGVPAT
jgi:hypothetical protein